MPNYITIDLVQGQSYSNTFYTTGANGSYINISGFSARGGIKNKFSETGYVLNLNPSVDTSYISGAVNVILSGYMTSGLKVGMSVFDIESYQSGSSGDGLVYKTAMGYIKVYPEISI